MILEDGGALPGRNMGDEIGSPDSYLHQGHQTTAGKLCTGSPRCGDSEGFELEEGSRETSRINRRCAPSERSVVRSIEDVEGNGDGELEVRTEWTRCSRSKMGFCQRRYFATGAPKRYSKATCVQMTRESKKVAGSHGVSAFSMRLCKSLGFPLSSTTAGTRIKSGSPKHR